MKANEKCREKNENDNNNKDKARRGRGKKRLNEEEKIDKAYFISFMP